MSVSFHFASVQQLPVIITHPVPRPRETAIGAMLHERSEPEGVARLRQEREQASFDTEALHVVLAGGAEKLAAWNAVRRSRTVLRAAMLGQPLPRRALAAGMVTQAGMSSLTVAGPTASGA